MSYPLAQWSGVRNRAASFGTRVIPWIRLCHVDQGEDWEILKQRLSLLVATAQVLNENTILPNYESEATMYGPHAIADYLYGDVDWNGDTGWSTLNWLQNGIGWDAFPEKDAVILQIFPKDARWSYDATVIAQKMGDCVAHARTEGRTYVGVTYQTYDTENGNHAGLYDTESFMHSTFPGNRIGHGEWNNWYG